MLTKEHIVQDKGIDNTLDLLKEGYLFIKNRVEKYNSNIFETHLLGEKTICMTGEDEAKLFYDSDRFQRNGAAPKRAQKTLFGENAIQTMDGQAHIYRKHLFLSLMTPEKQKILSEIFKVKLEASIDKWKSMNRIILFDEASEVLCEAACLWAGVPLAESEIKHRAEDFCSMVYALGAIGPEYWRGKIARSRAEEWIKDIIEEVRLGKLMPEKGTALYDIAFYEEPNGSLLDSKMAAIELINVLRPIVAISTFITFSALAIYEHPECKENLLSGNDKYLDMFVHEVRRYYPFSPFIGARVRESFTMYGYEFKKGMLVLLDMYGTNHHPEIWENPNEFHPERYKDWKGNLYNFIPQGGGDPAITHRCPGEGITVEIMKAFMSFLVNNVEFEVPEQNLSYSLTKIPSLPESGFIMKNIRHKV